MNAGQPPTAPPHEFALLRRRIHAAVDGDAAVVAGLLAAWAGHQDEPEPDGERHVMQCPFPGHDDLARSCSVSAAKGSNVVRVECGGCGNSGDVVTAHQLICGSSVRQAMRAVWAALAGSLWTGDTDDRRSNVAVPQQLVSIIDAAAAVCRIPAERITGRSRAAPLVQARHLAMYVARAFTDFSYPQIAAAFDGRDHTTVLYAVKRMERLIPGNADLRKKVEAISAAVRLSNLAASINCLTRPQLTEPSSIEARQSQRP